MNSMDNYDADTGAEHQAEGEWKMAIGKVKERYSDLTDDEIGQAEGNLQVLGGIVQKKYGIAKEEWEKMIGRNSNMDETEYRRAA